MTQPIVAGERLLELGENFEEWVSAVREWEAFLRRHGLVAVKTPAAVGASNSHGHWPAWASIQARVQARNLELAVQDVVRLFAFLTNRFADVEDDRLILATGSDGCLATSSCPSIATEIATAALLVDEDWATVAGARVTETERVTGTQLTSDGSTGEVELSIQTEVSCAPLPVNFLSRVELLKWADRPELAIEAIRLTLARDGNPEPETDLVLLPSFLPSLDAMPLTRRVDALRSLVLLTLPLGARPGGLRERPIRTSASGSAPSLTSQRGNAYRVTLSTHGTGWRLHYWRDATTVAASVVADHDTLAIPT